MKRGGHYYCNSCRHEIDPRALYSVTLSKVRVDDVYEVEREWHFCAACVRRVSISYPNDNEGGF